MSRRRARRAFAVILALTWLLYSVLHHRHHKVPDVVKATAAPSRKLHVHSSRTHSSRTRSPVTNGLLAKGWNTMTTAVPTSVKLYADQYPVQQYWVPPDRSENLLAVAGGAWRFIQNVSEHYFAEEVSSSTCSYCCLGDLIVHRKRVEQCRKKMTHAEFILPHHTRRQLHPLMDSISLLQHHHQRGVSVKFVGDSLLFDLFLGAFCELRRTTSQLHEYRLVAANLSGGFVRTPPNYIHIQLDGHISTLSFLRNPMPQDDPVAIHAKYCENIDLLLVGWGMWFNQDLLMDFRQRLKSFFKLFRLHCPKTRIIYYTPKATHFHYPDPVSHYDDPFTGEFSTKTEFPRHCDANRRSKTLPLQYRDVRGEIIHEYAQKYLGHAFWLSWKPNRNRPSSTLDFSKVIHLLPTYELTLPFYHNYADYWPQPQGANVTARPVSKDCVHSCYGPYLFHPYWDAIFMALNDEFRVPDSPSTISFRNTPILCRQAHNCPLQEDAHVSFVWQPPST